MNINFQTISGLDTKQDKLNTHMEAGYRPEYKPGGALAKGSAYAINLNSNILNNDAYNEQVGKSKEAFMDDASKINVTLEENYKVLMSNTMSPEDYAKAAEEGFNFNEMDPETAVTILDKIKTVLAEAGTTIEGYNDDLDIEKLIKLTGNRSLANAIQKNFKETDTPITNEAVKDISAAYESVSGITELSESMLRYMTSNQIEPTIENIYRANYSTNGQTASGHGYYEQDSLGYYAQKADTFNWNQIEDQVKKVVEEAGFDVDNYPVISDARWIIEKGLPLTPENIEKVEELKKIDLPLSEDSMVKSALNAIVSGKKAAQGNVLETENIVSKAKRINEEVKNISEEAVTRVVLGGKKFNIKNLDTEQKNITIQNTNKIIEKQNEIKQVQDSEEAIVENKDNLLLAKKQLEEIRLSMTTEANIRMIRKGFQIETAPIEKVIQELQKSLREDYAGEQISDKIARGNTAPVDNETYKLAVSRISFLPKAPIAIIGEIEKILQDSSLDIVINKAQKLEQTYLKAGEMYETLMTKPRKDLGDNIKKAFRNVDDILDDMGLTLSEDNRRAVRILGYNSMLVNADNIERIKLWDAKLKNIVDELNPAAVLKMIRDGKNPLEMTIDETLEYLHANNNDDTKTDDKYARFLYKLEKNSEITEAERKSFIGIYRLFNNLEKTNNSAIGMLLEAGSEMTLNNLLTANRNRKVVSKGMDYIVDDSFGGVDLKNKKLGNTISDQINSAFEYYASKARNIFNKIEPEKLHAFNPKPETTIPELSDAMDELEENKELNEAYYREQVQQIRTTMNAKDAQASIDELMVNDIMISSDNIKAMIAQRSGYRGRTSLWEKVLEQDENLEKEITSMRDELDEENFEEKYLSHIVQIQNRLSEIVNEDAEKYIDIKALALINKQLTLTTSLSQNKNYDIPIEIDGQKVSMHVLLKEDSSKGTKVEASVRTEDYGYLSMAMQEKEGRIEGAIMTDRGENADQAEYMKQVKERLIENLSNAYPQYSVSEQEIVLLYRATDPGRLITGSGNGFSDTRVLLGMAKAFLQAL